MLFTPKNAQKVMNGTKTQTRRLCREGDEVDTRTEGDGKPIIDSVYSANKRKWQVGRTYSVQPGRGKPGIGKVFLKSIRRERVFDITEEDAKAEGAEHITPSAILHPFNHTPISGYKAGFRQLWDSIYGAGNFDTGPMVWALEFEVL